MQKEKYFNVVVEFICFVQGASKESLYLMARFKKVRLLQKTQLLKHTIKEFIS